MEAVYYRGLLNDGRHTQMTDERIAHSLDLPGTGTHLRADGEVIVHVAEDGAVRACANRCSHQNARFHLPDQCVLTCPFHGWMLDASTMRYLGPMAHMKQPEYRVELQGSKLLLWEPAPPAWEGRQPRRELVPGAFTATPLADGGVVVRVAGPTLLIPPPTPGTQTRSHAAQVASIVYQGEPLEWMHPALVYRVDTGGIAGGQRGVRLVGLERWFELGPLARAMVIRGNGGLCVLVEAAGHRIFVAQGTPERWPRDVDAVAAPGERARLGVAAMHCRGARLLRDASLDVAAPTGP